MTDLIKIELEPEQYDHYAFDLFAENLEGLSYDAIKFYLLHKEIIYPPEFIELNTILNKAKLTNWDDETTDIGIYLLTFDDEKFFVNENFLPLSNSFGFIKEQITNNGKYFTEIKNEYLFHDKKPPKIYILESFDSNYKKKLSGTIKLYNLMKKHYYSVIIDSNNKTLLNKTDTLKTFFLSCPNSIFCYKKIIGNSYEEIIKDNCGFHYNGYQIQHYISSYNSYLSKNNRGI